MRNHSLIVAIILLLSLSSIEVASAGLFRNRKRSQGESSAAANAEVKPLPFAALSDIDLSLTITKRDVRGLPEEISVKYANRSPRTIVQPLPRPAAEEVSYSESVPSIAIGIAKVSHVGAIGPGFLYTKERTPPVDPLQAVILRPGEHVSRHYDLSSFCMIGHGIGTDKEANFSACFGPGKITYQMRAVLVSSWSGNELKMVESNSIRVQLSEPDISKHRDFKTSP